VGRVNEKLQEEEMNECVKSLSGFGQEDELRPERCRQYDDLERDEEGDFTFNVDTRHQDQGGSPKRWVPDFLLLGLDWFRDNPWPGVKWTVYSYYV